ncbi:MAG: hypothetical protein GY754_27465, partial [bacterium]|nr:hypothetical protein [bacterium]
MLGKYAYVADSYYGLQIIDISDPLSPVIAAEYDESPAGSGEEVFVSGAYAYMLDDSDLFIIDLGS